jgi:lysine 6-dehydrogenase
MKMVVLGAGKQGSACAYDLLTHGDYQVVLADRRVDDPPPFLRPFLRGRLELRPCDASDAASLSVLLEGASATMSALPYYLNAEVAALAVEAGSHFCDLGGNTEIVMQQKELHARAVERGVSVIPDCGLAPGMVNILAQDGIDRLDHARAVRIKVGGLPQHPEPPLNYQIVYSLEGVLDYYTTRSWVLRDGKPQQVEALSERERIDFPGVGELEAFHTAGGLSTMAQRYAGQLESMEYKTLRYPEHAAIMEAIRELGLLATEPVEVNGSEVVPRDAFVAIAGPKLRRDPRRSPDVVVVRVEVEGKRDGEDTAIRYDLLDRYDPQTGITAMMRTTGYSLAITGAMQAAGEIAPGVWTPDEGVSAAAYVEALRERGIEIQEELVVRTTMA